MFERIKDFLRAIFLLGAARDPKKTIVKRVGFAFVRSAGGGSNRNNFEAPSFDFDVISAAYDTESYVRQAIDKYVDLIFKAGWQLKGKNEKSLQYIKSRLGIIAEATLIDTNTLLAEMAHSLVQYANVFVIKARLKESLSVPGIKATGVGGLAPVGGYFVLPPSTIQIARDANGTVLGYQQQVPGQNKPLRIKPEDMIHIYWKKPLGQAYGVPFLLPVLDDIRLLREIEDNVSNLLYKYLHPLYKVIVGLNEPGKESTPEEVQQVRDLIAEMPKDGTLVLPERYDVDVVGAEGEAIRADWALEYFERRVFTGLGVPETVFGRANTANRSTAENLTVEMHDRVKAFQRVLQDAINFHIIRELLLEGGFDTLVKPEDAVFFEFNEIAIDEKIKLENQAVYLWEHNQATFEETRHRIGLDPVVDESRLYVNMIKIPEAIAVASAKAQAGGEGGTPETNNKVKPRNQHGVKLSPKKTAASVEEEVRYDSSSYAALLKKHYTSLRKDVASAVQAGHLDQVPFFMDLVKDKMKSGALRYLNSAFSSGALSAKRDCKVSRSPGFSPSLSFASLRHRVDTDFDRFFNDLQRLLSSLLSQTDPSNRQSIVYSSFDTIAYRLNFMAETQLCLAYNYGYALSAQSYDREELQIIVSDSCCSECLSKAQTPLFIFRGQSLIDKIPPWHPNCRCQVKIRGDTP